MNALLESITFLFWVFFICYLVAWYFSMQIVTKAAAEKGYADLNGKLWFIGLFGLIFTPGIIVAALPDKKVQGLTAVPQIVAQEEVDPDELPDL